MHSDEETWESYREVIEASLSKRRYLHSLHTAEIALELAARLPEEMVDETMKFRIKSAALVHDIAKEIPLEKQKEILLELGEAGAAQMPGPVMHAYTGAAILTRQTGIRDPGIIHAVKYHTTGCAQMPLLSRLVFAADFLESTEPQERNRLIQLPLGEICLEKLVSTFRYLMDQKRPVQDDSLQFYNILITSNH